MGQLLAHSLEIPNHPKGMDDMKFLVKKFTKAVQKCLDVGESGLEPYFLFGYHGKLHGMYGDYQISSNNDGFSSVGSGSDLALGAMHVTKGMWNPEKRILNALKAAEAGNAAVRAPFILLKK